MLTCFLLYSLIPTVPQSMLLPLLGINAGRVLNLNLVSISPSPPSFSLTLLTLALLFSPYNRRMNRLGDAILLGALLPPHPQRKGPSATRPTGMVWAC
ncbi:hypothetical protein V8C44DRAFT_320002 [Trichoderma aethiopicum]